MASAVGDLASVRQLLARDPDLVRTQVGEKYFPKVDPRSGGSIYIYGFGWARTPHMVAHQFGHAEIFELLMRRSSPWLPLAQACDIHHQALAREIVAEHPSVIASLSPLASRRILGATTRNNTKAVELLLEAGWPAAVFNDKNQTPLHYAAWHGNLVMVRALLARTAPVNVFETEHGGNPLVWALHGSQHAGTQRRRLPGRHPGATGSRRRHSPARASP